MDSIELKAKAIEAIKHYTDLGNKVFNQNMTYPKTDFSVRGQVGGKYATSSHTVMVNMVLFAENVEDYIKNTIPHEVAHAFQRHIYGQYDSRNWKRIMPHGNEWKRIMLALGKSPKRCHNYDTSNATQRTVARNYVYACKCMEHKLTAIRHTRIVRGETKYRCKLCNTTLAIKN